MNNGILNVSGTNFTYLSYFKFYNFDNKNKSNNTIIYISDKNMPILPPLKTSFKPLKSKK